MHKIKTLAATLLVSLLGLVACQPQPARPMTDEQWRATVTYAAAVEDAKWRAIVEYAAAVEAHRLAEAAYRPGQCGGSLPSCSVMRRESGGDIRIWNGGCYAPIGWRGKSPCGTSSASGKWQMIRGTWGGFGGYVNAADAPERVQDERARILFAGGAGAGHWRVG